MRAERGRRTRFVEAVGILTLLLVGGMAAWSKAHAGREAAARDSSTASAVGTGGALQKAVFAGGCFWGVQLVFQHVKGVTHVTSGYSGGSAVSAHYELVGRHTLGLPVDEARL